MIEGRVALTFSCQIVYFYFQRRHDAERKICFFFDLVRSKVTPKVEEEEQRLRKGRKEAEESEKRPLNDDEKAPPFEGESFISVGLASQDHPLNSRKKMKKKLAVDPQNEQRKMTEEKIHPPRMTFFAVKVSIMGPGEDTVFSHKISVDIHTTRVHRYALLSWHFPQPRTDGGEVISIFVLL